MSRPSRSLQRIRPRHGPAFRTAARVRLRNSSKKRASSTPGDVIADQHHDQQPLGIGEQAEQLAGRGIALFVQAAQAELIDRDDRRLGPGEEKAQPQAKHEQRRGSVKGRTARSIKSSFASLPPPAGFEAQAADNAGNAGGVRPFFPL